MRIAITGGNGDMGRNLTPYLLGQGHTIVSIDRALPATQMRGVEFLIADTRDFGQFIASIRDCEALIHLAAIRSPANHPDLVVYADNTISSYNALSAASALGIKRVCLASSINAIGGAFSRSPHYDYFPVDEKHPTYAEDPYGLSKWVLEQQADAFARRYDWMTIASLRFHWLLDTRDQAVFYITAPYTISSQSSSELARQYYSQVEIRGDFADYASFFNCAKAARLLGWKHKED